MACRSLADVVWYTMAGHSLSGIATARVTACCTTTVFELKVCSQPAAAACRSMTQAARAAGTLAAGGIAPSPSGCESAQERV